jgi:dephospho-CoA kinase
MMPQTGSSHAARVLGLTGGIATGKSTVSAILSDRAAIVDADRLAREVVEPGQEAWREIVELFGREALREDDTLDRAYLRGIVFKDPDSRKRLEAITHPRIRALARKRIVERSRDAEFVIYDAPLLFEARIHHWLRPVILVACARDTQARRLRQRDGLDDAGIERHLNAQMPLAEKRRLADFIIENDGTLVDLKNTVARVWEDVEATSPARYIFLQTDPPESGHRSE